MSIHDKAQLPRTKAEALLEAGDADEHAQACRNRDMHGSARQFELLALLLRFYAEHNWEKDDG